MARAGKMILSGFLPLDSYRRTREGMFCCKLCAGRNVSLQTAAPKVFISLCKHWEIKRTSGLSDL